MAGYPRALVRAALAGAVAVSVAACAQRGGSADPTSSTAASTSAASSGERPPTNAVPVSEVQMAKPGQLSGKEKTLSPDILVYASDTLPTGTIADIAKIDGVADVNSFAMASYYNEERNVTIAAVDPATFRRFTPANSALTQAIWNRVAGGEMAIRQDLGKQLQDADGYITLGNDSDAPKAHVGAYAPMVQSSSGRDIVDAVVNEKWIAKLPNMKAGNALLISTGSAAPRKIAKAVQKLVGKKTSVQILAVDLDTSGYQTAVVTGGSVAAALGTLRYTPNANGSVNPDPAWVHTYIRTEEVPIIGKVTCNKVMLPELRAALTEVVARGLADKIHPSEYGGCFVPRFIAGTQTLSFHTFGTAIDLNVPENQRGTVGKMDRSVVAIFKKWGFGWGGDWHYTDPMHFELHRIVAAK